MDLALRQEPTTGEEVDLVEAVAEHRALYMQRLEELRDFYKGRGYAVKQGWADFELKGLRSVKAFEYVADAEVPSIRLEPAETIVEAEAQFQRATELMKQGGHGVPIFYRQKVMIEAADVLRDLVDRFPTSEKVDDAAYLLGEIHKEYLPGQESIAVQWYERCWTWNPQTAYPARFQAAVVFDYRLHDRDRALELYKAVLQIETQNQSNLRFAQRRIDELTSRPQAAHASSR